LILNPFARIWGDLHEIGGAAARRPVTDAANPAPAGIGPGKPRKTYTSVHGGSRCERTRIPLKVEFIAFPPRVPIAIERHKLWRS
jgi:hypothetical protein